MPTIHESSAEMEADAGVAEYREPLCETMARQRNWRSLRESSPMATGCEKQRPIIGWNRLIQTDVGEGSLRPTEKPGYFQATALLGGNFRGDCLISTPPDPVWAKPHTARRWRADDQLSIARLFTNQSNSPSSVLQLLLAVCDSISRRWTRLRRVRPGTGLAEAIWDSCRFRPSRSPNSSASSPSSTKRLGNIATHAKASAEEPQNARALFEAAFRSVFRSAVGMGGTTTITVM